MSAQKSTGLFAPPPGDIALSADDLSKANDIEQPAAPDPGKIFTFYSFKGGVGRSMSMANIAVLVASQGNKVLLIDFDLEAPGLEHFFSKADPSLMDRIAKRPGLIDLMQPDPANWRDCVTEIKFEEPVYQKLNAEREFDPNDCRIDILHSGKASRGDAAYAEQVQTLNWSELYETHQIGNRFGNLRAEWIAEGEYDYVFIDSRTGVTDIGDLCTVVLPDHLVMLFVTNQQNVEGISNIYHRAVEAHGKLPIERGKLTALPVLSRDEFFTEYERSGEWREIAAEKLAELFVDWLPRSVTPMAAFQKIFIPYFAIWSFGEALPVVSRSSEIANPSSINAAYMRVARLIMNDLNWASIDELADPADIAQARDTQQRELEERRAAMEADFAAREKKTLQSVGIGMLGILALVVGIGYWLYSSAVDTANQQAKLAEEAARTAQVEAQKQIEQAKETEAQLKRLQDSVDTQIASLERNLATKTGECQQFSTERDQARAHLAKVTNTARTLEDKASEACKAPLQEIVSMVSQDPGNASVRDFIRQQNAARGCFLARAEVLGVQSAFIEAFFSDGDTPQLIDFSNEFEQKFGYESQLSGRPVSSSQCLLLDFIKSQKTSRTEGIYVRANAVSSSDGLRSVEVSSFDPNFRAGLATVDAQGQVAFVVAPLPIPATHTVQNPNVAGPTLYLAFGPDLPKDLFPSKMSIKELIDWLQRNPNLSIGLGYTNTGTK